MYPMELSRAMCRGAAREKEFRNQGLYAIGAVQIDQAGNVDPKKLYEGEHEEDMEGEIEDWPEAEQVWPESKPKARFYDSVTGEPLIEEEVLKARKEELEYFRDKKVYTKVPRSTCWEKTGKNFNL